MDNLGDFAITLPLRYAFVSFSIRLKQHQQVWSFFLMIADQASGEKHVFLH